MNHFALLFFRNIDKLEYFLRMNKGKNFLKSHGRDVQKFIQKQGLDKTFVECEYRMWRVGDRRLPAGIFIDGGSDWVALHRDFIEYAVNSGDDLVTGLKSVFKYTLLPAEVRKSAFHFHFHFIYILELQYKEFCIGTEFLPHTPSKLGNVCLLCG